MTMMRRIGSAALLSMALLLPAAAASAETADYPGGPEGEVLSENLQAPTGGGVAGTGATRASVADPGRVSGLAVTGTDVLQLTALGGALVVGGTVVVRRSRRRPAAVTA